MSNLDMTEAIRMLAGDRGISVDSLLQVLVEALATAAFLISTGQTPDP